MRASAILTTVFLAASLADADPVSTSANHTLLPDDSGGSGGRVTGATVTAEISVGTTVAGGVSNVTTTSMAQAKFEFTGQLFDTKALGIRSNPPGESSMQESDTLSLSAALQYDDDTFSTPVSPVQWTESSDVLDGISVEGLVTSGIVYEDTLATVHATFESLSDPDGFTFTVQDSNPDNFTGYEGDNLNDGWQITWFGFPPNPNAAPGMDPDFDGRDNALEELTGFSPIDSASYFQFEILSAGGGIAQLRLNKVIPSREYRIEWSDDLKTFQLLDTPFTVEVEEDNKIVTDSSATGARKFYRPVIARQ